VWFIVVFLFFDTIVTRAEESELTFEVTFENEVLSWENKIDKGFGSREAFEMITQYPLPEDSLITEDLLSHLNKAVHQAGKDNDPLGVGLIKVLLFASFPRGTEPRRIHLETAIQFLDRLAGEVLVAFLQYELGVEYLLRGRFNDAHFEFNAAEKVFREEEMEVSLAMILNSVGNIYSEQDQYEDAIEKYHEAENIYREQKMEYELGGILLNKGRVSAKLGCYNDGLKDYNKAEKIFRTKNMKADLAGIFQNKGSVFFELGRYEETLDSFNKAKIIFETEGMEAETANVLVNISNVYAFLRRFEDALKNYVVAEKIYKERKMENALAYSYLGKGNVYRKMNRYVDALKIYDEAANIFKGKKMIVELAGIFQLKGIVYYHLDQYEEALSIYDEAEKIYLEKSIESKQAILLVNKGNAYHALANYEAALDCFDKAENIFWAKEMEANKADILVNKGSVYESLGNFERAVDFYMKSIEIFEDLRGKVTTERLKTAVMATRLEYYEHLVVLLVKMGEYKKAFHYNERSKARSFLDLLAEREKDIQQGVSAELLEQKNILLKKISFLQRRIIEESTDNKESEILHADLARIEEELAQLERKIKTESPAYANLVYPEPLGLDQVQKKILNKKTAIFEYYLTDEVLILWAIKQDTFAVYTIDINAEEISKFINVYRTLITDRFNIEELSEYAHILYKILIGPAASEISDISRLIVVPDGPLHYLPFHTLKTDEDAYLIRQFNIIYSPSASVITEIDKWKKEDIPRKDLIAFAVQDFEEGKVAKSRGFVDSMFRDFYRERGCCFQPLAHTLDEVNGLEEIYEGAVIYRGTEALEFRAKNECENFRMVHFATHGILDEENPMYSGVILSRGVVQEEDGFLQAYEIYNIKLNADLVVLSACRTGLGKLTKGEGLISLARAFMYAGSPTLIVSLWNVEDISTAFLMKQFYSNLQKGLGKDEALRQAQLSLIYSEKAHPVFWAPFVLIGDWR
jgi:CHAT domain-containing protein